MMEGRMGGRKKGRKEEKSKGKENFIETMAIGKNKKMLQIITLNSSNETQLNFLSYDFLHVLYFQQLLYI